MPRLPEVLIVGQAVQSRSKLLAPVRLKLVDYLVVPVNSHGPDSRAVSANSGADEGRCAFMAHSAWWVGLLQVLLVWAALVLSVRARPDVPGVADLSFRARLTAGMRQHPWQLGAAVLCLVGASVCGIIYYF